MEYLPSSSLDRCSKSHTIHLLFLKYWALARVCPCAIKEFLPLHVAHVRKDIRLSPAQPQCLHFWSRGAWEQGYVWYWCGKWAWWYSGWSSGKDTVMLSVSSKNIPGAHPGACLHPSFHHLSLCYFHLRFWWAWWRPTSRSPPRRALGRCFLLRGAPTLGWLWGCRLNIVC